MAQTRSSRFEPKNARSYRWLAVVGLAVCLLLSTLALATASDENVGADPGGGGAVEENDARIKELPGLRTATSKTFLLADGSRETQIYETSVNYRDQKGGWQPISQELRETASGSLTNGENSFDVHLPEDLDEAPVRVILGDHWVSQVPLGIETQPADLEKGGVASYALNGESADLEFTGLANGLKETIVLDDSSAPATYYFLLEASAGVVPELAENGSVEFRDIDDDRLVADVPQPFMVDAADVTAPEGAVRYSLEAVSSGGWRLAVEADSQWLQAPERSWPVIIDPSVTIPAPSRDCIIATTTENQMCGTSGYSYLTARANYPSASPDQLARTLMRFDLGPPWNPAIPKAASLTSATVGLYSAKTATNVTKVDLYDVNKDWAAGYAVSWANYWPAVKWTTAGGDFGKYMKTPASVSTAARGSQPGPWEFSSPDLTNLVEGWRDPSVLTQLPNHGLILKLADETPRVCCIERRVEWESSAGAKKPYLSVTYIMPATADSKITSPSDGTKSAKRFMLTSAWDHSNVEGVAFQYKRDGEYAWRDIPGSQVIDKNMQAVTWPYGVDVDDRESEPLYWDASSLADSKGTAKVKIRAVLSGAPGASGYTKPVQAELDQNLGGPKDAVASIGPGSVDLLTGNFNVSRTDVSIPGFAASLQMSRSINSRDVAPEKAGVLGQGWQVASPVEQAGGSAWRSLRIESTTETFEGETFTYKWAALNHLDGTVHSFEIEPNGELITPPEMTGTKLYRLSESQIALTDPAGNRTTFSNFGSGVEYWPISVAQTGGSGNKTQLLYDIEGSKRRLKFVAAPTAEGISCPELAAKTVPGCRALEFTYQNASVWGAPSSAGMRLEKITFYAFGQGGPWEVARYSYDSAGRLIAAWDPRISPALKETYTYTAGGQLQTLTPPGQKPWTFSYTTDPGGSIPGRLISVKRPSLLEGTPIAQTTLAYGVPLSGSGAPYDLSPQAVAAWGQEDLPADGTAIFPPDEVPGSPPSSYARATVHYMDAEGQTVNVASPQGAGSSGPSISTTETDVFGNLSRELTPENRLRALAAGPGSAAKARELDTQFKYSANGSVLVDERGPVHSVRLEMGPEAGTVVQARNYRSIQHDKGAPELGPGVPMPGLATHETTGALVGGKVLDQRSVEYVYDWSLRQLKESIVDPEDLKIRSVTKYDSVSGLPVEVRQPKDAESAGAGTTKIVYYKPGPGVLECQNSIYAGLPCKVEPASQPVSGPQLPITRFLSYSALGSPTEVIEQTGGSTPGTRKTITTYDSAGRRTSKEIIGGGVQIPKVETIYSSASGVPTTQRFVCPPSEPLCDKETITTTLDDLGRVTEYLDADGNKATTTYDLNGRPATFDDGKATQSYTYDAASGLLVQLTDSMAGTFTASYDADGRMTKRGLPNGLTAEAVYDAAGVSTNLTYTKVGSCGASCTWLEFAVSRSSSGKILSESGTLGANDYSYDRVGRLVKAEEKPVGSGCTTRTYGFDNNSNRTSMSTHSPGIGGVCTSSGGSPQSYSYDGADRLAATGLTYDAFGRITSLPSIYAGGGTLQTSYFSNDMVASQTQGGVTNTFSLDAALRQRQRTQAGGLQGVEVFHYANGTDSPAWTQLGEAWTRNIIGIGGELIASAESGKSPRLQLTNLHGDVVATASINSAETQFTLTGRFDEFGKPVSGTPRRFGWLGGAQRRTEFPSGVIQMGARSYIPAIGRFLSKDPVAGGSANAYDYGNADPVNQVDYTGLKPHDNDCDPGIIMCKCKLHIKMWSPRGGRMGVRMSYYCNQKSGIRRYGFEIAYGINYKNDDWDEFFDMDPPRYLNSYPGPDPDCKNYMECINAQDNSGTFACNPGDEYQIHIDFKYRYNYGVEQSEMQVLSVTAQEFCTYR